MVQVQFDLFLPKPSETEMLQMDIKELTELIHRVRKGQYAKLGALTKMYLEMKEKVDIMERNICRGDK
jgi:hypothetical protein